MRFWTACCLFAAVAAGGLSAQPSDEHQALRNAIQRRFDVVPLSNGIALRPKAPMRDVRLIEIADGTVAINGVEVTGNELRGRVGAADRDAILKLSYLSPDQQRAIFAPAPTSPEKAKPQPAPAAEPVEASPPSPPSPPSPSEPPTRRHRSRGDRVQVFGNVSVAEDEEIMGSVVAVLGSARIDGEVRDQVVAVLGSVHLGPKAVVHQDVVSVGGRVRRAPGSQTRGGVTEVTPGAAFPVHVSPDFGDVGPFYWWGGFGGVPRLIGTGFRLLLLMLLTGLVLLIARPTVDAAAERVSENLLKATLVGLAAGIMTLPVLLLTSLLLILTVVGIPLLVLLPFVLLFLVIMALVGFTGTAAAAGRWVQRRFGLAGAAPFATVVIGMILILSPLLIGRLLGLAGWPLSPVAVLFISVGFVLELLAWATGFGAVLSNALTRWQARRAARVRVTAPPPPAHH